LNLLLPALDYLPDHHVHRNYFQILSCRRNRLTGPRLGLNSGPQPLRASRYIAHGTQVIKPLDYTGRQYPRYPPLKICAPQKSEPKLGDDLLHTDAPYNATFHCTQPNGVREKRYNKFLHPSVFWCPRGTPLPKFTNLGDRRIAGPPVKLPNFIPF